MTTAAPADKVTILGSSAGMPQPDRATSGYLLTVNRRHSLIDCGGGVCSSFLRRGFAPTDVDRIFITHTHPDHCTELPLFLQMLHLAGRTDPIDLYLPEEFVEPFRVILAAMYIPREKLPFEPRLHGYGDGFRFANDFTLIARENTHLHHNRELFARLGLPNRMQSHSFEISVGERRLPHDGGTKDLGDRRLFYTGDIKSFEEIRPYLDGCIYILVEVTHIDLEPLIAYAQSATRPATDSAVDITADAAAGHAADATARPAAESAVGRLVFVHIESPAQARALHHTMQKAGISNYVTAVDGLELPL